MTHDGQSTGTALRPGDLVVKIDWENRHLDSGVVLERDDTQLRGALLILFPSGPRWEYDHDLIPASAACSTSRR